MKAVKVHEFGGPEVLKYEDVQKPVPKENEVLIKVHASSINPVDIKSIAPDSRYKEFIHFPLTPGLDIAGVIEETGSAIINLKNGDHVFGQASALRKGSGAFAEYAITNEDSVAAIPANIDFKEAAALPLVACSAYQAIVEYIKIKAGQKILIHGGSGGIGTVAIQLAKHFGAHVTTTASDEAIDFVRSIGADEVIDYKEESFENTDQRYDGILDTVGGNTYSKSFKVLKRGGVIVSMLNKPDKALMEQYGVMAILEMTKINRAMLNEIAELVENNVIKINIAKTYPLEKTMDAYKAKEDEKIIGKIAITVS